MLNKIPNFVLVQSTQPWGRRFPKRGPAALYKIRDSASFKPSNLYTAQGEIVKRCTKCHQIILNGGVFHPDKQYHYYCEPEYVPSRTEAQRQVSYLTEVEKGNLPEDEYRFWVGSVVQHSGFAQCRACHKILVVGSERAFHKVVAKGEEPCTNKLVAAYKVLLARHKCLACGSQTYNQRWGVPLCATAQCLRRFKFSTAHYMELETVLEVQNRAVPKIIEAAGLIEGEYE